MATTISGFGISLEFSAFDCGIPYERLRLAKALFIKVKNEGVFL